MATPLVSIITLAYNHEAYVSKCLDGFMMQKTTFPIEVLIHDDASNDKTASIIREYQNRFPEIIKPIFQEENQYRKGVFIGKQFLYPLVKGKYVALCEGDDYWTDPYKLQKQFDYMESHPDCSLCFTNALIHWYSGDRPDAVFAEFEERDYSGVELTEHWISPTASFFFKATILPEYCAIRERFPKIIIGDSPLLLTCAKNGTIHGMTDVTCVYGKHAGAWTQYSDGRKTYLSALSWENQLKAFGKEYKKVMTNIYIGQYILAISRGLKDKDWSIVSRAFLRCFCFHPINTFKSLFKMVNEHFS